MLYAVSNKGPHQDRHFMLACLFTCGHLSCHLDCLFLLATYSSLALSAISASPNRGTTPPLLDSSARDRPRASRTHLPLQRNPVVAWPSAIGWARDPTKGRAPCYPSSPTLLELPGGLFLGNRSGEDLVKRLRPVRARQGPSTPRATARTVDRTTRRANIRMAHTQINAYTALSISGAPVRLGGPLRAVPI